MAVGSDELVLLLKAQTGEFKAKMGEARGEVSTLGSEGKSGFSKFQAAGTVALLAVGAAAFEVGKIGLEMADKYEKAHARLEVAVKNAGQNFEDFKGKVSETDKQLVNLGFSSTDTESAMATLTNATHNVAKASQLMSLAADIARGRNISLEEATGLLTKVELGRYSMLTRLGVASKAQVANIHSEHDAVKLLTGLYGGQASAYTETFAGKMEVLKTKAGELGKNIGLALIPIIEQLASKGLATIEWIQRANDATGGWIGKLTLLAAGGTLAFLALSKIVSAAAAAAGAVAGFAESVALFVMINPEVSVALTLLGAAAAGIALLGANTHDAALSVRELTDAALDEYLRKQLEQIDKINNAPLGPNIDKDKIALEAFNNALKQGLPEAQRFIDAMDRAGMSTGAERQALEGRIQAQAEGKDAQEKVNAAVDKGTEASNRNADAVKQQAEETKKLAQHLKELNDMALASANSEIRQQQAIIHVSEASRSLTEKLVAMSKAKKGDQRASDDLKSAQLNLRSSLLDAVAAAEANAEAVDKNRSAHGKNISAIQIETDKHNAGILAIAQLKNQFPGLTKLITEYAQKLGLIPKTVQTDVVAVFSNVTGPGGHVRRFAEGGYVDAPAGAAVPAIVHGGEYVMSRNEVAAGGRGPGGYQINVYIAPGGNQAEAGRQIVDAITAHERRSGRVYARS